MAAPRRRARHRPCRFSWRSGPCMLYPRAPMMRHALLAVLTLLVLDATGHAAPAKAPSLSPRRHEATDLGRAPATERHRVVVALDLRNRDALEAFLADVQDPASPRYQQFLTPEAFNGLHAPAPETEQ